MLRLFLHNFYIHEDIETNMRLQPCSAFSTSLFSAHGDDHDNNNESDDDDDEEDDDAPPHTFQFIGGMKVKNSPASIISFLCPFPISTCNGSQIMLNKKERKKKHSRLLFFALPVGKRRRRRKTCANTQHMDACHNLLLATSKQNCSNNSTFAGWYKATYLSLTSYVCNSCKQQKHIDIHMLYIVHTRHGRTTELVRVSELCTSIVNQAGPASACQPVSI